MIDAKALIPAKTFYCYTPISWADNGALKIKCCPFWRLLENREEQSNGYCLYLQKGDWGDKGTVLLWDQCKECGINDDFELEDLIEREEKIKTNTTGEE